MTINETRDCIKLTPFEEMVVKVIKGLIWESWYEMPQGDYYMPFKMQYFNTVKSIYMTEDTHRIFFQIKGVHALFSKDLKRIIEPLMQGHKVYISLENETQCEFFLDRFVTEIKTIVTYNLKLLNKNEE